MVPSVASPKRGEQSDRVVASAARIVAQPNDHAKHLAKVEQTEAYGLESGQETIRISV